MGKNVIKNPLISVVMPVYNGENYLSEAIDSILNQTYADFEFIILNDGSTDKTEDIILSYSDPRIVYVKNPENLQIVKTLNKGISLAKGKYIARMDADDISLPQRFSKQVGFMEANLDVGVCGAWIKTFGEIESIWSMPTEHDEILVTLLFNSCIMHPTAFLRKSVLSKQNEIYDSQFNKAEDYELWTRLILETRFANIPEVLLRYRLLDQLNNRTDYKLKQKLLANQIRIKYLSSLSTSCTDEMLEIHNRMLSHHPDFNKKDIVKLRDWFLKLNLNVCDSLYVTNRLSAEKTLIAKSYAIFSAVQKTLPKYFVYKEFSKLAGYRFFTFRLKFFIKIFLS